MCTLPSVDAVVMEQYLQYLKTVPMEFKAMLIAKDHLGSSFDLVRSNGFQAWIKSGGSGTGTKF
jgi:hypothetical protein